MKSKLIHDYDKGKFNISIMIDYRESVIQYVTLNKIITIHARIGGHKRNLDQ